jgi:hypothetical protein
MVLLLVVVMYTTRLPPSYDAWIVPDDAMYVRQDAVILPAMLESRWPHLVVTTEHASHNYCIPNVFVQYRRVDDRYHDDLAIVDIGISNYVSQQRPVIPTTIRISRRRRRRS